MCKNKHDLSKEEAGHNHALDAMTSQNVTIVFLLNVFFSLLEFVFGFMFNSSAILSDAVHDTGDAAAIGLAWFLHKFSRRKEDEKYSFGYQRFSLLGASITSVILITGSVVVLFEAVPRLLNPEPVESTGMLFLSIFAILANGFGAWLLARGSSRSESILNLHALEDVLGWLGVLVVSVVLHFRPWYWLDPLLSIAIAIFILTKALPKFWGTIKILLESTPEEVDYGKLLEELEDLPEVRAVTQLIIWSIDGEQNAAMIHVMVPEGQDFLRTKHAVRQVLVAHKVCESAIELDENSQEHQGHPKWKVS